MCGVGRGIYKDSGFRRLGEFSVGDYFFSEFLWIVYFKGKVFSLLRDVLYVKLRKRILITCSYFVCMLCSGGLGFFVYLMFGFHLVPLLQIFP